MESRDFSRHALEGYADILREALCSFTRSTCPGTPIGAVGPMYCDKGVYSGTLNKKVSTNYI